MPIERENLRPTKRARRPTAPVPEPGVVLPPGYLLEMDPDVLILRGDDGSMVAVFSAPSADPEEVKREAEKDYRGRGESAG